MQHCKHIVRAVCSSGSSLRVQRPRRAVASRYSALLAPAAGRRATGQQRVSGAHTHTHNLVRSALTINVLSKLSLTLSVSSVARRLESEHMRKANPIITGVAHWAACMLMFVFSHLPDDSFPNPHPKFNNGTFR